MRNAMSVPDIAEYRLPDRQRKLVNVLVGQREAQTIFAGFRQNRSKRIRRKILELVNEQVKVAAFGFRPVCPRHCAKLELRHQKGTKQIRLVMSKLAFGQVGDEQPLIVHDEGNVHFRFDLAQNVPNHRIQKELADFVLDRRDGLAFEPLVVVLIFLRPKRPDERVFDLPDHLGPVCRHP